MIPATITVLRDTTYAVHTIVEQYPPPEHSFGWFVIASMIGCILAVALLALVAKILD